MTVAYGYYIFSATHRADNGTAQGVLFLAESWDDAELVAARLGLTDISKLKGLYHAGERVLDWAKQKGVTQCHKN